MRATNRRERSPARDARDLPDRADRLPVLGDGGLLARRPLDRPPSSALDKSMLAPPGETSDAMTLTRRTLGSAGTLLCASAYPAATTPW